MFVSVPPNLAVSDLVRLMKGRSSHKVQREFPQLKKRYWGRRFWGGRVFLNDQRCHHGRHRTSVLGAAHRQSHRRQPVGGLVINEGCDLNFEVARQEVVFRQDAVLERLMPSFHCPPVHCAAMSRMDLALSLRMIRRIA